VANDLVSIGTFALRTGLSILMLRCHRKIGLQEPSGSELEIYEGADWQPYRRSPGGSERIATYSRATS